MKPVEHWSAGADAFCSDAVPLGHKRLRAAQSCCALVVQSGLVKTLARHSGRTESPIDSAHFSKQTLVLKSLAPRPQRDRISLWIVNFDFIARF